MAIFLKFPTMYLMFLFFGAPYNFVFGFYCRFYVFLRCSNFIAVLALLLRFCCCLYSLFVVFVFCHRFVISLMYSSFVVVFCVLLQFRCRFMGFFVAFKFCLMCSSFLVVSVMSSVFLIVAILFLVFRRFQFHCRF